MPICLPACLPVCLPACLSVCLYPYLYPSVCLFLSHSVFRALCLPPVAMRVSVYGPPSRALEGVVWNIALALRPSVNAEMWHVVRRRYSVPLSVPLSRCLGRPIAYSEAPLLYAGVHCCGHVVSHALSVGKRPVRRWTDSCVARVGACHVPV